MLAFMPSRITERIEATAGCPGLFSALSQGLAPSDLQSLLIEVFQRRSGDLREPDVLRRAGRGLVTPSKIDGRLLNEFDRTAFEVAKGFEAIELAPVSPLGLNHVLGAIDQNNVLTTIRNAEVLGDPTTALALECWRRRKSPAARSQAMPVRLATSHRVVRLQPFDEPGYTPHFRLFALVSAGRDRGSNAFEIQHLGEHIRFYLLLFRALNTRGFHFGSPLVEISDCGLIQSILAAKGVTAGHLRQSIAAHRLGGSARFLSDRGIQLPDAVDDPATELRELASEPVRRLALVKTELVRALESEFPEAQFRFNLARLEGLGYYKSLALRISPVAPDGNRYPITDGGFTDWTARLLEDRKERLLATGVGSEFACFRYREGNARSTASAT
jgi:hypothetical protein